MPATISPNAENEWRLIAGLDIPADDSTHGLSLVSAGDFAQQFQSDHARALLGTDITDAAHPDVAYLQRTHDYPGYISRRLASHDEIPPCALLSTGIAALWSFLQSNVTGPPLPFTPETLLLPPPLTTPEFTTALSKAAILLLSVDGESAYHLTPNALFLSLACSILTSPAVAPCETATWWRMRANFTHQKVLSEATETLHDSIYADLQQLQTAELVPGTKARLLVEAALVDTFFGHDTKALAGLEAAAAATGLEYALTGVLGKRTKFQQSDTSQLVVLAQSTGGHATDTAAAAPNKLDLNDDTLLEKIAFTKSTTVVEDSALPAPLAALDPGEQPKLQPLDAAILLLVAETIKNTNPAEGLTREEMMPYAERVLQHPTNWEVYTLGLLVRSKLEGYRSRTIERGLLQLQAVVDQVIADTTDSSAATTTTTFLPRASAADAAPVSERLAYIHQLSVPTRWALEAELAARWISLGGLRTALEIYTRLEMWAEVALCYAATDKEQHARRILREQLFDPATDEELSPPPANAPRLWCIFGDLDSHAPHYEKAWVVSGNRYARAQRSLGRLHFAASNHAAAATAYEAALTVNALNAPSWFALGCCSLELQRWPRAIEAFTRCVALDETDAEAWSNLASALLHKETTLSAQSAWPGPSAASLPQTDDHSKRAALTALRRATAVKHDAWRIWENLLVVAATVEPPSYTDVAVALARIIELRGVAAGESCIDTDILSRLVRHVIVTTSYDPAAPGLQHMLIDLVTRRVVPLITGDARLWRIVATLARWRGRPREALDAEEKAWRAVGVKGVDTESDWEALVEATEELVGAYESLGEMEREGLGEGVVAKDWRFKARSCVRGVMGRGKECWEESEGWRRMKEALEGLKL